MVQGIDKQSERVEKIGGTERKLHVIEVHYEPGFSEAAKLAAEDEALAAYEAQFDPVSEADQTIYVARHGAVVERYEPLDKPEAAPESDRPERATARDPVLRPRPRRQKPDRQPFGTTCTTTDEPQELEDLHLPDRGFGKYGVGRLPYNDGGRLDSDFLHRNEPEDHRALRKYAEKLASQKFPRR